VKHHRSTQNDDSGATTSVNSVDEERAKCDKIQRRQTSEADAIDEQQQAENDRTSIENNKNLQIKVSPFRVGERRASIVACTNTRNHFSSC
jgi:hypothetical protein